MFRVNRLKIENFVSDCCPFILVAGAIALVVYMIISWIYTFTEMLYLYD